MAMTLEQVKRILADHKSPSFDRDTVQALVGEIEDLKHDVERYIAIASAEASGGWLADLQTRFPIGTHFAIQHDGFAGSVCGYYRRDDGKCGVNLQLDGARVVHVYGEKWLEAGQL